MVAITMRQPALPKPKNGSRLHRPRGQQRVAIFIGVHAGKGLCRCLEVERKDDRTGESVVGLLCLPAPDR